MNEAAREALLAEFSELAKREYRRARNDLGFLPFHSGHEGYAVLLEEVQELWEAVRRDDLEHARHEAIQVAAMALAFAIEAR